LIIFRTICDDPKDFDNCAAPNDPSCLDPFCQHTCTDASCVDTGEIYFLKARVLKIAYAPLKLESQILVFKILTFFEFFLRTPFFIGRTHFCTTNFGILMETSFCSAGNQHYQKIIYFLIFSSKRSKSGIKVQ